MGNIYQNISSNKRDTIFIMLLFIGLVSIVSWFIGEYSSESGGLSILGPALIISGITSFISYFNSDKIVLSISKAKEVSYEDAPDLHNLVDNVAIASGILKPKVYVIEDSSMNAFATGRDPNHGVICLTTGIMSGLEKRELEGVIAHEMSHIGNFDTRLMSIVSILVGSISLIADWFTRGIFFRRGRKSSGDSSVNGVLLVIGLLLIIVSPIIATLIKLAISRKREFLADSTASLITRYPKGLANALRKLSMDKELLESANSATAHLYITDPVRGKLSSTISNFFNTHPPIEERIKRLENM